VVVALPGARLRRDSEEAVARQSGAVVLDLRVHVMEALRPLRTVARRRVDQLRDSKSQQSFTTIVAVGKSNNNTE
jgi:hypothetical protein